ncbi:MAG: hypothetical protein ACK46X_05850 [Candidatus Sericytochromatia bacterium]
MTSHPDFPQVYQTLLKALQNAPYEQLELLATTDATYAYLSEVGEELSDEDFLSARILLGEAETILGRYFGM